MSLESNTLEFAKVLLVERASAYFTSINLLWTTPSTNKEEAKDRKAFLDLQIKGLDPEQIIKEAVELAQELSKVTTTIINCGLENESK